MMEERLKEILTQERLTPARFAELVGVQRSSVSHIISGRNKPSLDFLQKILSRLDHISPDWLISGIGPYKRSDATSKRPETPKSDQGTVSQDGKIAFPLAKPLAEDEQRAKYGKKVSSESQSEPVFNPKDEGDSPKESDTNPDVSIETSSNKVLNEKKIKEKKIIKTLLFYDDQTFEVFYPGN
jgi:transcriptional regulator with XRE-family HTH domain